MKFRNEKFELGTRFYTFISEDEYRIVTFVKDNNNKSGQFMDEETFELETITEDKLFDKFTLLADNSLWIICNFKTKDEFKNEDDRLWLYNKNESFWLYNDDISNFLNNQIISYPYEVKIKLRLVIYKFMKASVFNKLINYIIKLNAPKFEISNDDIDSILSDLQIKTSLKENIAAILFSDLEIKSKRIEIRKLRVKGLNGKYIRMFIKLLEYIAEI